MQDYFFTLMFEKENGNTGLHCFVEEQWIVLKENRFPDSVEISGNLSHVAPFIVNLYK